MSGSAGMARAEDLRCMRYAGICAALLLAAGIVLSPWITRGIAESTRIAQITLVAGLLGAFGGFFYAVYRFWDLHPVDEAGEAVRMHAAIHGAAAILCLLGLLAVSLTPSVLISLSPLWMAVVILIPVIPCAAGFSWYLERCRGTEGTR